MQTGNTDSLHADSPEGAPSATRGVYERLRGMILSGELPGGSRLKQVHLARLLNSSPTPIREALKILEQEGWVVSDFGKGCSVRTFTEKDIIDVYEFRQVLDGFIALKAAVTLTDQQREELKALAVEADARDISPDDTLAIENKERSDMRFHMTLAEWVGNMQIVEMFRRLMTMQMLLVGTGPAGGETTCNHQAVAEAICGGDAAWAESVATRHMQEAYQRIRRCLGDLYQVSADGSRKPIPSVNRADAFEQ